MSLRHSARVAIRRLRTADYSDQARDRLASAVTDAREADGYQSRPAFARAANISLRVLAAVENAEPTVGEKTLRAIGRTLSNWTPDTPRTVLEGGPIPPLPDAPPPREPERTEDEVIAAIRRSAPKAIQDDLIKEYLFRREQYRRDHPDISAAEG
ncbi:hypothetical protein [Prauserella muralis]|nr:hypothetical protein [Prauserella muralis]TWE22905.1 hypothetical protein FHX69_4161 [Prauserella muralis]